MATRTSLIALLVTLVFTASAAAQTGPLAQTLSNASRARIVATDTAPASSSFQAPPAKRDSRLNGLLIGLIAGAVPGIVLGMGFARYCENEASSCPAAIPITAAVFGLAGAGIGYAIDGAIGQSVTSPRPPPAGVQFSIRF